MPKCQSTWVHYQYRPCALLSDAVHKSLGYFLYLRGLENLGWKLCKSYKTTTSRESVQIPEFTSSWLPCILEGCFSPVNSAIRPLLASRRNHWEHLLNFVAIKRTCMVNREMRGYIVTAFHVPLPHNLCTHTTTQSLCSPHLPPPTSPGPLGVTVQHPWLNILIRLHSWKMASLALIKEWKLINTPELGVSWALSFLQNINIIWKKYERLWEFRIVAGWVCLKANFCPLCSVCFSVCCLVHGESRWDPRGPAKS